MLSRDVSKVVQFNYPPKVNVKVRRTYTKAFFILSNLMLETKKNPIKIRSTITVCKYLLEGIFFIWCLWNDNLRIPFGDTDICVYVRTWFQVVCDLFLLLTANFIIVAVLLVLIFLHTNVHVFKRRLKINNLVIIIRR